MRQGPTVINYTKSYEIQWPAKSMEFNIDKLKVILMAKGGDKP